MDAEGIRRLMAYGHALQAAAELVQQAKPTLVYVNPRTDPDAFDLWQTPPDEGDGLWVGRPCEDNRDPGQLPTEHVRSRRSKSRRHSKRSGGEADQRRRRSKSYKKRGRSNSKKNREKSNSRKQTDWNRTSRRSQSRFADEERQRSRSCKRSRDDPEQSARDRRQRERKEREAARCTGSRNAI